MMDANECWQSQREEKVFAIGDTIKPGLLTHAIASGREVAEYIDAYLNGWELVPKKKPVPAW
jgi:NADPH-dependent glutamate synthase beta subunit-like oxidoreductase